MSLLPYAADHGCSKITARARLAPLGTQIQPRARGRLNLLLIGPTCGMIAGIAGALACLGFGMATMRQIGGHAGDGLGAIEQTYELIFLLVLSGLAATGHAAP
jgi:cobalamin synthase